MPKQLSLYDEENLPLLGCKCLQMKRGQEGAIDEI